MPQGGQERTGAMATVKLLLLPMGLTLLSVAAVDKEDLVIPAAYRAGTFPATTEKVRALGTLRVESGFLGHDLELGECLRSFLDSHVDLCDSPCV